MDNKYDSRVHKYCNPHYHNVDRMNKNLHILTDNPNSRWFSEINTIDSMLPLEARYNAGYYQIQCITKTFEKDVPTWNVIKL